MTLAWALLIFVAIQRFAELLYAGRNTRRLLAQGGVEVARAQYPLFVLLHGGWLMAIALWLPANVHPNLWLVAAFVALQALRIWAVGSLGPYWTTRLITLPTVPIVRTGPYRWFAHPNYVVVVGEIAILPLALGEPVVAAVFSVLNAALLVARIGAENRTLTARRLLARADGLAPSDKTLD